MLPFKKCSIWPSSFRREYIFSNRPSRNKNYLWQPCFLLNHNDMDTLYRTSIDASCLIFGQGVSEKMFFVPTNQKQEYPWQPYFKSYQMEMREPNKVAPYKIFIHLTK